MDNKNNNNNKQCELTEKLKEGDLRTEEMLKLLANTAAIGNITEALSNYISPTKSPASLEVGLKSESVNKDLEDRGSSR